MLKLSVILPTRNRSASLRVFLRSVAQQNLPREDYEVIVIDDGSSDDTPAVLEERWPFTLRTIRHANKGAVESRNIAAASAGGRATPSMFETQWTLSPGRIRSDSA